MRGTFSLPTELEAAIANCLPHWKMSLEDSRRIAEAVLKMSDFYLAHPEASTPWKEDWCQVAQLAYFLPLNFLRSQAVFGEAQARQFPLGSKGLVDFGSGLGAGSLPWLSSVPGTMTFVEVSNEAQKWQKSILQSLNFQTSNCKWMSEAVLLKDPSRLSGQTALFSYSLTELSKMPAWALKADSLIVIEPSTRDDGRLLLQKRKFLLQEGFSMWAPCPHQLGCPLLEDSKTDWCHDRIAVQLPKWMQKIEEHLPMKNQTLTFSYLLASRQPSPVKGAWRTVGDPLIEKGKTRQLVCRGPQRQFLAWLHRKGPAPEIPRGVLMDPPAVFEEKANEIRL